MRVETFERLLAAEGQDVLAEAVASAGHDSDLALGSRLRKHHDPELVAAAVSQARLRAKARTKLGDDAAWMYFTPDALEQATRTRVADHRARRLVASGTGGVVDLGCGIGADLVAVARAGLEAYGVDLDPLRVAMARANLAALGLRGVTEVAEATAVQVPANRTAFADPARRSGGRRVFDPRQCEPPWELVTRLLAGRAVVKTMPGIAHDLVPDGVEAEWVSDGGDLVEACLWGAPLASARRRATLLPSAATVTDADDPGDTSTGSAGVGAYLYEPDDAVTRAGLVTAVAAMTQGRLVDPHLAYVTSDRLVPTPFARAFRVVEELPYREKQLKAALRARDVGALTVKKRGVEVVPEQLVRRLALRGAHPATIVLTRVGGAGRAYLVDPLP